jgi:hypothetical protein
VLFLSSWVNDLPVKPMSIHPAAKKQHEKEVRDLQQEITDLKGKLEPFILGHAEGALKLMISDARQHEKAGCSGSCCDEETPVDESARIRSGRKLLQQVRAIHSRYKMSHTKEAGVLETEMQSQSKAGAGQKTVRDRSSELFNVLFSVGNYQLTKASLEHLLAKPEVQMLRENSDRKDKNRKRAANQMEGRDAEALDMVMGSFQKFFTSLLSDPGGKRRKGRLDDESRNAFYAAAAALIPADFMDKRMGRSLERLTNIPRKMLPKVAAIKIHLDDPETSCHWKKLCTKLHCDRVEPSIIDEWWHTDEASRVNNANKAPVKLQYGYDCDDGFCAHEDPAECPVLYDVHWPRQQIGSMKFAVGTFQKSEFYHVQQGGFSRGSGLQAGNAAVDAVWLDCVDTENMRYQYVGGEA